jgi:hypothetical protein
MSHPFRVAYTFDFGTFAIMKSLLVASSAASAQGVRYLLQTIMV